MVEWIAARAVQPARSTLPNHFLFELIHEASLPNAFRKSSLGHGAYWQSGTHAPPSTLLLAPCGRPHQRSPISGVSLPKLYRKSSLGEWSVFLKCLKVWPNVFRYRFHWLEHAVSLIPLFPCVVPVDFGVDSNVAIVTSKRFRVQVSSPQMFNVWRQSPSCTVSRGSSLFDYLTTLWTMNRWMFFEPSSTKWAVVSHVVSLPKRLQKSSPRSEDRARA